MLVNFYEGRMCKLEVFLFISGDITNSAKLIFSQGSIPTRIERPSRLAARLAASLKCLLADLPWLFEALPSQWLWDFQYRVAFQPHLPS